MGAYKKHYEPWFGLYRNGLVNRIGLLKVENITEKQIIQPIQKVPAYYLNVDWGVDTGVTYRFFQSYDELFEWLNLSEKQMV